MLMVYAMATTPHEGSKVAVHRTPRIPYGRTPHWTPDRSPTSAPGMWHWPSLSRYALGSKTAPMRYVIISLFYDSDCPRQVSGMCCGTRQPNIRIPIVSNSSFTGRREVTVTYRRHFGYRRCIWGSTCTCARNSHPSNGVWPGTVYEISRNLFVLDQILSSVWKWVLLSHLHHVVSTRPAKSP